jgi:hypothetical protein
LFVCLTVRADSLLTFIYFSFSLCRLEIIYSSFLSPDRLEKLNIIGFVWSIRDQPLFKKASSEKLDDSTDIAPVDVAVAKHDVAVDGASNEVHVEEASREEGMLMKVVDDEVAAAATAVATEEEPIAEHVCV